MWIIQKNVSDFPSTRKLADGTPACTKESRNDKTNYRLINILPNLSKVFEWIYLKFILNKQMAGGFFEQIFPKYQIGFLKRSSAQNYLISMIEKCNQCLGQNSEYPAWLTDIFTVADFLPHYLIIAKLHPYGFDLNMFKLILSYLTGRELKSTIYVIHTN